ncbi:hypothetical protein [Microvirga guangxiensis]|uniref:Uncharacterized protein n=1 Tax=Microvirga guangxiensis TaxID=549386 RepID=A0A1G5EBR8_9HYPH|nr:hypothetical protein [Microvirga guangxiensis]SCY23938.1 hypothetical protein SAMN02927923_00933 [Microvirga guangxiensis]
MQYLFLGRPGEEQNITMNKLDRRRSPQENKKLSYERDCSNQYGENDKAARKAVRRFKAASNRAGRRGVNRALHGLEHAPDEMAHEIALFEAEHMALKPKQTKVPDAPLKDVVPYRMRARIKWATALRPIFKECGETGITSPHLLVMELERRRISAPYGKTWTPWLVHQALRSLGVKYPWEWDGKLA